MKNWNFGEKWHFSKYFAAHARKTETGFGFPGSGYPLPWVGYFPEIFLQILKKFHKNWWWVNRVVSFFEILVTRLLFWGWAKFLLHFVCLFVLYKSWKFFENPTNLKFFTNFLRFWNFQKNGILQKLWQNCKKCWKFLKSEPGFVISTPDNIKID